MYSLPILSSTLALVILKFFFLLLILPKTRFPPLVV